MYVNPAFRDINAVNTMLSAVLVSCFSCHLPLVGAVVNIIPDWFRLATCRLVRDPNLGISHLPVRKRPESLLKRPRMGNQIEVSQLYTGRHRGPFHASY